MWRWTCHSRQPSSCAIYVNDGCTTIPERSPARIACSFALLSVQPHWRVCSAKTARLVRGAVGMCLDDIKIDRRSQFFESLGYGRSGYAVHIHGGRGCGDVVEERVQSLWNVIHESIMCNRRDCMNVRQAG